MRSDARAWAATQQEPPEPGDGHRRPGAGSARGRRRIDGLTWLLLGAAVLVALAVASLTMWRVSRSPSADKATSSPASAAKSEGPARRVLSDDQLRQSVARARKELEREPGNVSALAMLAHSQAMLGDFDGARQTYRLLADKRPGDAQVLADWADAAAVAQGRRMEGEPARLVGRALQADPTNLKALMLAGREAFERKQYGEAIGFWERARRATPDPRLATEIDANIAEARAFDGRERPPAAVVRQAGGPTVAGRITLAPALASHVSPDDTVFVFARPLRGSRMPVALMRKKVRDLPLSFTLDDSMAMVPEIRLSMLASVAVGARISKRGDATPQPGDLQGMVEPVKVGARDVQVEITEVLR